MPGVRVAHRASGIGRASSTARRMLSSEGGTPSRDHPSLPLRVPHAACRSEGPLASGAAGRRALSSRAVPGTDLEKRASDCHRVLGTHRMVTVRNFAAKGAAAGRGPTRNVRA